MLPGKDVQIDGQIDRQFRQGVQGREVRFRAYPEVAFQQGETPRLGHPAATAEESVSESAALVVRVMVKEEQHEGLADAFQPEQRLVVEVTRPDQVKGTQGQSGDGLPDALRTFRRTETICLLPGRKIRINSLHNPVKIGKNKKNTYFC